MRRGQTRADLRIPSRNRDLQKARRVCRRPQSSGSASFSFRSLDLELPNRGGAEVHRISTVADRRNRVLLQALRRMQRPQQRVRVEENVHRFRFAVRASATQRTRFGSTGSS